MKILVVDDEPGIRDLVTMYVEGILKIVTVIQANSGNEALKILQDGTRVDAIISDFTMAD